MTKKVSPKTSRGVRRGERLTNCSRDRCGRRYNAFTLIELIVVVGIIAVLAALVLSTVGYARKKGARARAETEIAAMSAACENYKADNGVYPSSTPDHNDGARCQQTMRKSYEHDRSYLYVTASLYLYTPVERRHQSETATQPGKSYMSFKPNMLLPPGRQRHGHCDCRSIWQQLWLLDGANPQANPAPSASGYNPTFDLWSTARFDEQPAQCGRPKSVDQKLVERC